MFLHPFLSPEFKDCHNSTEKRLEALFFIKNQWTKGELQYYIEPFLELGINFDSYLMKNLKVIKEKNPFDSSKEIVYYLKKF